METLPAAALPLRVLRRRREPRGSADGDAAGRQRPGAWQADDVLRVKRLLRRLHPDQQHQQPLPGRGQNQHRRDLPALAVGLSRSPSAGKPNGCPSRLRVPFPAGYQTLHQPVPSEVFRLVFGSARQQAYRGHPLSLE